MKHPVCPKVPDKNGDSGKVNVKPEWTQTDLDDINADLMLYQNCEELQDHILAETLVPTRDGSDSLMADFQDADLERAIVVHAIDDLVTNGEDKLMAYCQAPELQEIDDFDTTADDTMMADSQDTDLVRAHESYENDNLSTTAENRLIADAQGGGLARAEEIQGIGPLMFDPQAVFIKYYDERRSSKFVEAHSTIYEEHGVDLTGETGKTLEYPKGLGAPYSSLLAFHKSAKPGFKKVSK